MSHAVPESRLSHVHARLLCSRREPRCVVRRVLMSAISDPRLGQDATRMRLGCDTDKTRMRLRVTCLSHLSESHIRVAHPNIRVAHPSRISESLIRGSCPSRPFPTCTPPPAVPESQLCRIRVARPRPRRVTAGPVQLVRVAGARRGLRGAVLSESAAESGLRGAQRRRWRLRS